MKKLLFYLFIIVTAYSCSAQTAEPVEKRSEISLVKETEPGTPFRLQLLVLDHNTKQPVKDVKIFAYHTTAKGDYENDSKGVARIHGTAYTNANGSVTFNTIYPRGYNDSPSGGHIHFQMKADGYNIDSPTLDFDSRRKESEMSASTIYIRSLDTNNGKMNGVAVIYLKKR
jgi:protocatechuate 3,4-dioxygenase, beta subunit